MPKKDIDYLFLDREDAAQQLLEVLPVEELRSRNVLVLALSPGGVIVADSIAREIGAQLQILLSAAIMSPKNKELAMARVSETHEVVVHKAFVDSFDMDITWVYEEAKRIFETKIEQHKKACRDDRILPPLKDRVVLLVDECVETDMTALLGIKSMISKNVRNVYLAVPVLDASSLKSLQTVGDTVYAPHVINDYISIEYYYKDLPKLKLDEIKRIIKNYE